ncbi:hypothetical protein [Nocardia sp. NPDC059239]|uniref:hypothetical protein n=1 Tax=unclassified Nocardia TaxID=2637762 RepID=UPI00369435CB
MLIYKLGRRYMLRTFIAMRASQFAELPAPTGRVVFFGDSAAQADAVYIDLWPALADANGALRQEFTRDGLHLSGAGYAAWIEVLRPHIAALRLER